MKNSLSVIFYIIVLIATTHACIKLQPDAPADDEILDGPVERLTFDQSRQFLAGDVAFNA